MNDSYFNCPVCGMTSDADITAAEHNGMRYFFCTQQCRNTFIAHPTLYSTHTKTSAEHIKTQQIKKRTLQLAKPLSPGQSEAIRSTIENMMGIESITIEGQRLQVAYDLLQVSAARIEAHLDRAGFPLSRGWLNRIRRGWVHEREETALANLVTGDAPCCNRTPKGH